MEELLINLFSQDKLSSAILVYFVAMDIYQRKWQRERELRQEERLDKMYLKLDELEKEVDVLRTQQDK